MLDSRHWKLDRKEETDMREKKGYERLEVYERSYRAGLAVYKMTKAYPKEEIYAITDQMRRASVSIPLNIAEGYAKRSSQEEFRRFLLMAIGSSNEMSVLIEYSKDLGYISEKQYEKASREYDEIGRMLNSFIQSISKEKKI